MQALDVDRSRKKAGKRLSSQEKWQKGGAALSVVAIASGNSALAHAIHPQCPSESCSPPACGQENRILFHQLKSFM
ncbi:hypothetical protein HNY73_022943 [Argiope bruennichi]|uniref:Uncharacterized protein n=1 Tax=Argiope bruennichi TaxID=94029 RepID=A0A8T0E2K6_ARGBR|nr:hypothetical protein HNY73_022943 [Argiope bruennichi]